MTEGKGAGKAAPETVDERAPETVTSGRGMRARLAWTARIEQALERDEFLVFAQHIQALSGPPEER